MTLTEEEALAALSEEARFEITFIVEPQPPEPRVRVRKPTKRKRMTKQSLVAEVFKTVTAQADPPMQAANAISRHNVPNFRVTAMATIFGRELKESYNHILPDNIEGVKEELRDRFKWFVKNVYLSKRIATGNQSEQVAVPLKYK